MNRGNIMQRVFDAIGHCRIAELVRALPYDYGSVADAVHYLKRRGLVLRVDGFYERAPGATRPIDRRGRPPRGHH
jgi:hypothetical protein